ncbi:MFS transporter [Nocardioides panacis]|nr:MFS transporter [Nocardioides panacis]
MTQTETDMAGKWWTLVAVCTGVFMLLLDITIVNVALPDIQRDLGASLSDLQWVIDAYALTLAALQLTAGSLADRYGRKRLFAIGTLVFTIGSLFCGLAPTVLFLSLARAAQGVGGAVMFATALALLSGAFHGRERGTAFAYFGATTGVAVAVGPVLGGVLTSGLSWHWIFWVNIPICVLALAVTLTKVEESSDPHAGRPDWIGFVTFSSGLGLLVLALIRGGVDGWGDSLVVGSFVASGVLLVSFVVSQLLQDKPMFDLGLLRKPTFVGGLVAALGVSASVFSLLTYLIIYVQNVLGYSAVEAGVRFLFLSGMSFVAAIIAGRLTSHVPTKFLIGPGFLVASLGLFLMRGITVTSDWTHLIPGLVVAGLGIGFINVPLASTAVGVVRPERAGMASGVNSTFRQVGIATGIAALGSIFAHQVASGIQDALAGTPAAGRADQVAAAVTNGQIKAVLAQAPDSVRATLAQASTQSFVDALNHITTIAAVIALVAGLLSLLLIRAKDFEGQGAPAGDRERESAPVA